jgi:hypothetical protein
MIDYLRGRARVAARNDKTGWARYGDILVAYYPLSRRFGLFVRPHGRVSRAFLERYIEARVSQ